MFRVGWRKSLKGSTTLAINVINVLTLCVEQVFFLFELLLVFGEKKKTVWRLANLFSHPQLIPEVKLLPHKLRHQVKDDTKYLLLIINTNVAMLVLQARITISWYSILLLHFNRSVIHSVYPQTQHTVFWVVQPNTTNQRPAILFVCH